MADTTTNDGPTDQSETTAVAVIDRPSDPVDSTTTPAATLPPASGSETIPTPRRRSPLAIAGIVTAAVVLAGGLFGGGVLLGVNLPGGAPAGISGQQGFPGDGGGFPGGGTPPEGGPGPMQQGDTGQGNTETDSDVEQN